MRHINAAAAAAWLAAAAAAWLVLEYLRFAAYRLSEPYALRWLETYLYRSSWQAHEGMALFPEASASYIAPIYNPLFFLVGGWAFDLFGPHYMALRAVSLLGLAVCGLALFLLFRVGGMGRPLAFAFAASVLLIPRALNHWMTTANLDAPMLALVLVAWALLADSSLSRRRAAGAGLLLGLALLTKQQALVLAAAAAAYGALAHGRRTWPLLAAFGVVVGGSIVALQIKSGGVYLDTTLRLPLRAAANPAFDLLDWCVRTLPIAFAALLAGGASVAAWGSRRERLFWGCLLPAVLLMTYLSGRKSGGTINNLLPYLTVCFWILGHGLCIARRRHPGAGWLQPAMALLLCLFLCREALEFHGHNGRLAEAHRAAPGDSAYRRNEQFEQRVEGALEHYPDPVFVGARFARRAAAGRRIENFHQTALYEGTVRATHYDLERILEPALRERRYRALILWRRPEERALWRLVEANYEKVAELGRDPLIGLNVDVYEPRGGGR